MIRLGNLTFVFLLGTFLIFGQNSKTLSKEELKTWWQKDLEKDSIPGIGLDRAYGELLKNRTGQEVIVAVLDTKIDLEHEDLKNQIWVNQNEIPNNGIDDDRNGYIDDINGWDFLGTKDGKDVVIQQTETTRIVKKYKHKYADTIADKTFKSDMKSYELYQKARLLYEVEVKETKEDIKYMDSAVVVFVRARDTVDQLLSKKNYAKEEVDSLLVVYPNLEDVLGTFAIWLGYGVKEEDFINNSRRLKERLNTTFGFEYDERAILKDNPHDLADVPYGDNTLMNNELDFQHSTPVSGLIAAIRGNGIGINGMSNRIKIMPIVMVAEGDEHDKEVALAIRYAVDNGADIINMSWGKYLSLNVDWVRDAFRYAADNDVLLVSGSGNNSKNIDIEPAYPNDDINGAEFVNNFIMVGGHTHTMDSTLVSYFSNYGQKTVDIFAPASDIFVLEIENNYNFSNGTSFASPIVSGSAALIKSYFPSLTATQIKEIILSSSVKLDMLVERPSDEVADPLVPFSSLSATGAILNVFNALKLAEEMTE